MKQFGQIIVKLRKWIILFSILLLIPSVYGFISTRINYDMLSYLPDEIDTIEGQNILLDEFGKGAYTCLVVEDMSSKDIKQLCTQLKNVEHVDTVLCYEDLTTGVPASILPESISSKFTNEDATMIAVFLDTSTSAEETLDTIDTIRSINQKQVFVSGASAMVEDLKNLCESQVPIYVILAVVLALGAMILTLDNFLVPFVFMISIGMAILYNMGTNIFMGQISFITMCLAAILQLAVTLDYSIFLWHSYEEEKENTDDHLEAMAQAISKTLVSITGSSTTTIAGFIALCFMTYTLGLDLGLVMAKGVVLGLIGCVTILPSLVLLLDRPLEKFNHTCLIPQMDGVAEFILKHHKAIIVLFVIILIPAVYGRINNNMYYDLSAKLSVDAGLNEEDVPYSVANKKLSEYFGVGNMSIVLYDRDLDHNYCTQMIEKLEAIDGVDYVLGLDSVDLSSIPEQIIPDDLFDTLESDEHKMMIINSVYKNGSDESNAQIDEINNVLATYDSKAVLLGEAPMAHDLISITNEDFTTVNMISIVAIFVIILLVTKSITLPFILVAVIEFAIVLNLGISYYTNTTLAFIAPICISTIQLGACVDYGIVMTNRYKVERCEGKSKKEAILIALKTSIPSIIVSAFGLFAATIGVTVYSNIDIISGICTLMARGAIISMISVILLLPALLYLCDGIIKKTTIGMTKID